MNMAKWSFTFLSCVVSLFFSPKVFAHCNSTPSYEIGKTFPSVNNSIVLDVSLPIGDFSPDKLVCLATALKEKFNHRQIAVDFFSSHEAARNYSFRRPEVLPKDDLWASKKHAEYYFNPDTKEEYLLLIPDGLVPDQNSPFNTRIDLATGEKSPCRLRIEGRCLLSFDNIYSAKEYGFGTVIVNAEIKENGAVSVKNAKGESPNSARESALTQFAVRNLKSWRFEPADRKTKIRITFSIEQVDTPLKNGINVEFTLPERVKIQIGPVDLVRLLGEVVGS